MRVSTELLTRSVEVECPYCNERQEGFLGDPSGGEFDCDDCGETYMVHCEADIVFR